ncbi:hypothetical protein HOY80DRAFT_313722 [Tuber brumale]|nr:hypothetical protein HOY80DRAFT_313722 [Tuber brumale]
MAAVQEQQPGPQIGLPVEVDVVEQSFRHLATQASRILNHPTFDQGVAILAALRRLEQGVEVLQLGQADLRQRLDGIEQRLDGIEQRLDGLDQRLDGLEQRLDGLEQRLDGVEQRLDDVKVGLGALQEGQENFVQQIQGVRDETSRQ